jgi:hypothetical protein
MGMFTRVQQYLLTHSFRDLDATHGVQISFARDASTRKISLNYNQILAPGGSALTEESRGMILRLSPQAWADAVRMRDDGTLKLAAIPGVSNPAVGETDLLARPFSRFYNMGDPYAAPIDWEDRNLRIEEKLDGTLCIVYHDGDRWCVATRSVPEADVPVDTWDFTFGDLFRRVLQEQYGKTLDTIGLNPDFTYMFELMTAYNTIVVRYTSNRIVYLGTRHRRTGREFGRYANSEGAPTFLDFDRPTDFPVPRMPKEVVEFINALNPCDFEGGIIVDSQFNRQKIKSLSYVAAHKVRFSASASPRNLFRMVFLENSDDLAAGLVGELRSKFDHILNNMKFLCQDTDAITAQLMRECKSQKDFALAVKDRNIFQAAAFAIKAGKVASTMDWFVAMNKADRLSDTIVDDLLKRFDIAV